MHDALVPRRRRWPGEVRDHLAAEQTVGDDQHRAFLGLELGATPADLHDPPHRGPRDPVGQCEPITDLDVAVDVDRQTGEQILEDAADREPEHDASRTDGGEEAGNALFQYDPDHERRGEEVGDERRERLEDPGNPVARRPCDQPFPKNVLDEMEEKIRPREAGHGLQQRHDPEDVFLPRGRPPECGEDAGAGVETQ